LLKLEYFRRYQLDVQRTYYRGRGKQHAESASQTLMLGGLAVLAGSVSAGAAGVLGVADVALTAFAALGVVGTALSAFATTREAMNQDRRNAERYTRTHDALQKLSDADARPSLLIVQPLTPPPQSSRHPRRRALPRARIRSLTRTGNPAAPWTQQQTPHTISSAAFSESDHTICPKHASNAVWLRSSPLT
jgi:hypothetical protein